jgi:hypothetical protein
MSCTSAAKIASDIFKNANSIGSQLSCTVVGTTTPVNYQTCQGILEFSRQMISFWNANAGNSWAILGPRSLDENIEFKGTLPSTGGRLFVSPMPLSKDKATLVITETDGKATTEVNICKAKEVNNGGTSQITALQTSWFNETKDAKDFSGGKRTIELSGVLNHIIIVKLDAKSVFDKFSYTIKLSV